MEDARRRLYEQIREWNESRVDLFALSEPNLDLEFFGVMRFYFQDDFQVTGEKVSTKCVRVSSTASARDVLAILIEKFRPDIRMLTASQFSLYEMHSDAPPRMLQDWECPLLVQLNWGKDDREGRIVMKRMSTLSETQAMDYGDGAKKTAPGFNRKLSKREKKELKKQEEAQKKTGDTLYNEMPETVLTRSISNPEMVMRRRRQAKLEKKLQQIRTSDGGPESGGTLKIYGNTIIPDVPYKTLLLSANDRADFIVKETLDKYGLDREDPRDYCLVKVSTPYSMDGYSEYGSTEQILNDADFPLQILLSPPQDNVQITFHLRRRHPDQRRNDGNWKASQSIPPGSPLSQTIPEHPPVPYSSLPPEELPFLLEVDEFGKEIQSAQSFRIPLNGLEVGRDRLAPPGFSHLLLQGDDVQPRHCVFRYTDTAVILTRLTASSVIVVNGARVFDTILLRHSDSIFLGGGNFLRFLIPYVMNMAPVSHANEPRVNFGNASRGIPATIDCREEVENHLLSEVLTDASFRVGAFRFVPAYVVYMTLRHMVNVNASNRRLVLFMSNVCERVHQLVHQSTNTPQPLALWMANAGEMLYFFKHDIELRKFSAESCERLASVVRQAFFSLVRVLKSDLNQFLPAFLDQRPDIGEISEEELMSFRPPGSGPVLNDVVDMLADVIGLLIGARINPALTIQIFSQLFHHINQWLFNRLVQKTRPGSLCTREWGRRLIVRLRVVEDWAERQGLELAADCHLSRISQAAHLLRSRKYSPDDITGICTACFRLNSLQVSALLRNYVSAADEPARIPAELIDRAIVIARSTADETCRKEGNEVTLLEDSDLRLPFLLPEDGYSADLWKGLPEEICLLLRPLGEAGLCRLIMGNPEWNVWNVFFTPGSETKQNVQGAMVASQSAPDRLSKAPQVDIISFQKINNSLGLSIVDAIGEGRMERNIYVKSVVPGGAAAMDGRIQAGDLLLEVDGKSLRGLTQENAARIMGQSGAVVNLKVIRQGAVFDGLAMLLNQPSPGQTAQVPAGNPGLHQFNSQAPIQNQGLHQFNSSPQLNNQPNQNRIPEPAGGRYKKLGDTLLSQSKSTSNINELDRGYQILTHDRDINVLKATHNLENSSRPPNQQINKPANVRPVSTIGPQYPYAPSSQNPVYDYNQNTYAPRNAVNDHVIVNQQPRTIQVPQNNVNNPYISISYPKENITNQPHYNAYNSQPDLTLRGTNGTMRNSTSMYPYNGNKSAQPNSYLPVTNMPSQAYQQSLKREQHQRPYNPPNDSKQRPESIMSRAHPAAISQMNGNSTRVEDEPQYARVVKRHPRSQSVPRNEQRNSTSEIGSRPSSTISPWVREEREKEKKEIEREKQRLRDEEIRDLEAAIHLNHDDLMRLKRLRLEADFDRRLDEVSKRRDVDEDDTELTAAGRARVMHENLQQRRSAVEQQYGAMEGRSSRRDQQDAGLYNGVNSSIPQPPQRKSSYGAHQFDVNTNNGYRPAQYNDQQQRQYQQNQLPNQQPQYQQQPKQQPQYQQPNQLPNQQPQYQQQPKQQPQYQQPNQLPKQQPQYPQQPQYQQQQSKQYQPQQNNLPYQQQQSYQPKPYQPQQAYQQQNQQSQNYQPYQPGQSQKPYQSNPYQSNVNNQQQLSPYSTEKKTVSFNSDIETKPVENPANRGRQASGFPYRESTSDFRNSNFGRQPQPMSGEGVMSPTNGYSRQGSAAPPTPGVVGAQEVYRDPRDRMTKNLMIQQNSTPERMSFRDKMKHFATEVGEDTPADRVKISRAQRDLELQMNGR